MGTDSNVIVIQPQGIFTAAVATTGLTATGTKGGEVTTTAWDDAGFVDPEGNITLEFGGEQRDVRPIGFEGPLKRLVTNKTCRITFNGLESVVASLEKALALATLASNEIPDGGVGEVDYLAVSIITDNWIFWAKKTAPPIEHTVEITDTEEAKLPFMLDCFVEEAATAGERKWKWLERTEGA